MNKVSSCDRGSNKTDGAWSHSGVVTSRDLAVNPFKRLYRDDAVATDHLQLDAHHASVR